MALQNLSSLIFLILFQEIPLQICPGSFIAADAIAYSKRPFIGKFLRIHCHPVQGACHYDKRAVSALSCSLAEIFREFQKFPEGSRSHNSHGFLIKLRPLFLITVRPILFQPVGKVSASDNNRIPPQNLGRLLNTLT